MISSGQCNRGLSLDSTGLSLALVARSRHFPLPTLLSYSLVVTQISLRILLEMCWVLPCVVELVCRSDLPCSCKCWCNGNEREGDVSSEGRGPRPEGTVSSDVLMVTLKPHPKPQTCRLSCSAGMSRQLGCIIFSCLPLACLLGWSFLSLPAFQSVSYWMFQARFFLCLVKECQSHRW